MSSGPMVARGHGAPAPVSQPPPARTRPLHHPAQPSPPWRRARRGSPAAAAQWPGAGAACMLRGPWLSRVPSFILAAPPRIPPPARHPTEPAHGSLLWRVRGMIRTLRPHQWVKNLFVLAPVVFAKHLTHPSIIKSAIGAFGVFCLLSGAIYTLNDIVDANADRVHPVKRCRPIASGQVPVPLAKAMLVALLVTAFGGAL